MTIVLRGDFSAPDVRKLAAKAKDAKQSRRLLAIAAVYDGMSRADAAKAGGMDRQTLRDWAHRFNADGPDGLHDRKTDGPVRKLAPEQMAELAAIVEAGPSLETDGVARWRRIDLKTVIEERFSAVYAARSVSRILHELGFSHMSARPRHPAQDRETVEAFKKTSAPRFRPT